MGWSGAGSIYLTPGTETGGLFAVIARYSVLERVSLGRAM